MSPAEESRAGRPDTIAIALALGISAGAIDACVALLNKPRGFEAVTALAPPMVAMSAAAAAVYLSAWWAIRPFAARMRLDQRAVAIALATFLGTAFTVVLLADLHASPPSTQTALKAAMVILLSLLMSVGAYAMVVGAYPHRVLRNACDSAVVAVPLLLIEVLLYQWLQVYVIDGFTWASIALILLLIVVGGTTVGLVVRSDHRRSGRRALATLVVALALVPVVAVGVRKSGTVQARTSGSAHVPPRVLLITVDTLRADAVSAYRADAPRTEAIDQLAADGVVFERALAPAPWTLPSLASIVSGLEPAAHRATGFTSRVSPNIKTVAEYLSDHGYYTGAIVHNDLLNPNNGLSQGFAEYLKLDEPWFSHSVGMSTLQAIAPTWFPPASWPSNDDQTRIVVDWLNANRDRDFFLWVHYLDPHSPYAPPREFRTSEPVSTIGDSFDGLKVVLQGYFVPSVKERKAVRALYDGEVRYVDANIGRIIATLKQLHLYDDTLVIFTSDHGEEFWEHGTNGHGHSVYDEVLRVPLIVKLPRATHRGRTTVPVSTVSIAPTILDASGIRYDEGNVSAASLLPLIDPAAGSYAATPLVSDSQILFDRREAVSFDSFKYIVSDVDGKEELFDLKADPTEQHSIAPSAVNRIETGRRLLQTHRTQAAGIRKRLRIEEDHMQADQDTVRRLRTLGYLR